MLKEKLCSATIEEYLTANLMIKFAADVDALFQERMAALLQVWTSVITNPIAVLLIC
jgi:hypothetical protein